MIGRPGLLIVHFDLFHPGFLTAAGPQQYPPAAAFAARGSHGIPKGRSRHASPAQSFKEIKSAARACCSLSSWSRRNGGASNAEGKGHCQPWGVVGCNPSAAHFKPVRIAPEDESVPDIAIENWRIDSRDLHSQSGDRRNGIIRPCCRSTEIQISRRKLGQAEAKLHAGLRSGKLIEEFLIS
jgi:hypothetical protein